MNKIGYGLFCIIVLNLLGISMRAFGDAEAVSPHGQLVQLEVSSGGRLGVAAINTGNNQRIQYRADESFPMQCTSKVMGVAAILKKSMNNNSLLQERIMYKTNDLTNWSPITQKHLSDGMTVAELCSAAISYSDNTAMNLLAKKLGGPPGINSFARSIDDNHFKLDHWWPDEALASPESKEDATTPAAMNKSLRKLVLGNVLTNSKREMLIAWLKNNTTGDARIRAGVSKNWIVGDKTGTGLYGSTNDIAVIWPAQCPSIIITIFYSSNKKEASHREDILASATRVIMNTYAKTDQCISRSYKQEK